MARPRRTYPVVIIPLKLTLVLGRDDDLIAFLGRIPTGQRAAAVQRAMRSGISQGIAPGAGEPDEQEELNEILDQLAGGWLA